MKRILIPIDFSKNSIHALDYAMTLFKGEAMAFYILNVQKSSGYIMDDLMAAGAGTSIHQAIAGDNKASLDKLVSDYRKKYASETFNLTAHFDFDTLTDAIAQLVAQKKIEMIIMGTNGASGAGEAVFGSNTIQVIRNINIPVLAIPENYKFSKLEGILLSYLDNHFPKSKQLKPLKVFIHKYQPQLHLLNISDKETTEEKSEHSKSGLKAFGKIATTSHSIQGVPVAAAIAAFIQLNKIDLHAMVAEKESLLDRFINGSMTSKISYGSKVPLLILNS